MTKYTKLMIGFISITNVLLAQGVDFPNTPSQAPIGGLELLIGAGGALAWNKLRHLHQK